MTKVTTNFGAINGRRIMTFKVTVDGMVLPSRWRGYERKMHNVHDEHFWITARESFRRWKIARKAWASRRRKQLALPI
jgi:hypothetical protein